MEAIIISGVVGCICGVVGVILGYWLATNIHSIADKASARATTLEAQLRADFQNELKKLSVGPMVAGEAAKIGSFEEDIKNEVAAAMRKAGLGLGSKA